MGYFSSCNGDSSTPIYTSITRRKQCHYSSNKVQDTITLFSYSELQIATDNFSNEMFLGKGSHGRVYKAVLHGGKLVAAVKKTKGYKVGNNCCFMNPADNEIEILSKVRNSGLVNLLGFCVDSSGEKLIVVEYMCNGTLYDLLHTTTTTTTTGSTRSTASWNGGRINKRLGWRKRVSLALEVARAVHSLHSANPPVIHRDIKSSNVLLDKNMRAKLGDFGLALRGHVEDVKVKCTPPAGTMGYLDPSYLAPEDLSTKSDVFSFGILLLEIISGRNAIDVDYSPPSIINWAIPLIKIDDFSLICDCRIGPPADMSIIQQLGILASSCVAVEAEGRPEMGEVIKCLKEVRKRLGTSSSLSWKSNFTRCVGKSVKPESESLSSCSVTGKKLVVTDIDDNRQEMTVVKDLKDGFKVNKNGTVPSLELMSTRRMSRSRSIGSVDEINKRETVGKKQESLSVKMRTMRLNKSRSVGILRSRSLVRDQINDQETPLLITDQQHKWLMDNIKETSSATTS